MDELQYYRHCGWLDYREGRQLVAYAKGFIPRHHHPGTAAAYARRIGWPEDTDYHSQTKSELEQYCYWRGLSEGSFIGRKDALVARLVADGCTADALSRMGTNRLAFALCRIEHEVRKRWQTYPFDGFGDKPAGMCRVGYWLTQFDPDDVASRYLEYSSDDVAIRNAPYPDSLRRNTRWMRVLAATTIQSTARRFLNNKAPPVTHEVVEGPNGDQVALEYRTAAERQAQIAAYLNAADDSDATVPRSDEETDHDSDATVERSDEEEDSDDGNTDAQRDRMMDAAMGQVY
jgi:hypothetical protein